MPGIVPAQVTRKTFLQASAVGAAALATRQLDAVEDTAPARVALLSDTHIPADPSNEYRGFKPVENLQQIVPDVVSTQPQVALINGDAARLTGELDDYRALKALLAPLAEVAPIAIGLGNHDHRGNFFQVFPDAKAQDISVPGKHVAMFELGGTRFIVLDSLLYVDKVAGLLGKAQRVWLERYLATADDLPMVFFVHHSLGDGDGDLLDIDRLFRIIQPHRQVKAIFYGHSHRYHIDQREHVFLINQPAVGYNFADSEPVGWLDASFRPTGVELKLHAIGGNREGHGRTKMVTWS